MTSFVDPCPWAFPSWRRFPKSFSVSICDLFVSFSTRSFALLLILSSQFRIASFRFNRLILLFVDEILVFVTSTSLHEWSVSTWRCCSSLQVNSYRLNLVPRGIKAKRQPFCGSCCLEVMFSFRSRRDMLSCPWWKMSQLKKSWKRTWKVSNARSIRYLSCKNQS